MARLLCALLAFVGLLVWGSVPQAQDTRQHWLSPKDGAGTETDAYRARCLGMVDGAAYDLTPHGVNMFWCASADLPANMTGVIQIGPSLASALGGRKGALAAALKKPLTANTVGELMAEIISPRLKAGKDGKLKIYLGRQTPEYQQTAWVPFPDNGLVADITNYAAEVLEPAMAWATTLTQETFTASDGLLAGCESRGCNHTWTNVTGTFNIVSNQAKRTTTSTSRIRAESTLATDDFEIWATLVDLTNTGTGTGLCSVMGRKDNGTTTTNYAFGANNDDTASGYQTDKVVAGSRTTLATSTQDQVDNDVIKLRMDGSSITGLVNDVIVVGPTTDTEITTNTYGGIYSTATTTTFSCILDNWNGADYVAPRAGGKPIWFQ